MQKMFNAVDMTNNRIYMGIVLLLVAMNNQVLQSAQVAFPGEAWEQVSPESQHMDSTRLNAAVEYLRDHSGSNGVERLIIVRNGRVIWKGPETDRKQRVWSVTKAFTSTAQGLLIEDGKCTLDTLAWQHNPKDLAEQYRGVTLRHFASMTSGYDGVGGSYDFDEQRRGDENALVRPLAPFFAPGTKYQYWDEATQQYGYVLTQIAGESLQDYLKKRVFDPIGMGEIQWQTDVTGKVLNWTGGLIISASDLARFGLLFLNEGHWSGKQLVPVSWVREATRVQVPPSIPNALASSDRKGSGVYGYHWWPNGTTPEGKRRWPDAPLSTYARSGYNNNDLFIIPAWNMVIVRLGLDQQEDSITTDEYNVFLKKVGEAILDPYHHPITVHHAKGTVEAWKPFLGDGLFSITSLQIGSGDIEPVVETFRQLTRQAGRPLPVSVDEFTVATGGKAWIPVDDSVTLRKEKLWPAYLSGGQVEFILAELLDTQDFRKYEDLWKSIRYARKFMEACLPFWDMEPNDELLTGESVYAGKTCSHDAQVFAKAGECYAVYLPVARQTGVLDLSRASGPFIKRWYNPRIGEFVGASESLMGGQKIAIGPAPDTPDEDWVVLITKR